MCIISIREEEGRVWRTTVRRLLANRTMSPTSRLVLLLLAAQIPETDPEGQNRASQTLTNAGQEFIVVFPENIAYYHPSPPKNKIWMTALNQDADITITPPLGQSNTEHHLLAGQTWSFDTPQELGRLNIPETDISAPFQIFSISDITFKITSTTDIVVQAISIRGRSMQSALVIPNNNLSRKYFIPPVPDIEGTTNEGVPVVNVTERGPFRLIIINPDDNTASVTIKGEVDITENIEPGKAAQIWVRNDNMSRYVEADNPVAVFFSHPCTIQYNCTCGLLHAMVPPAKNDTVNFPIPPVLAEQASILQSAEGSRHHWSFDPASAVVHSAGTAMLYRPGLLLTLIPENEFGSCFVVHFIENKNNFIIIIVHKDHTKGIHIGKASLEDADWKELKGTLYVSTEHNISSTTIVWHASAKMAVYHMGNKNGTWFGSPAPVVSASPDFRGCAVISEKIKILDDAESWQNSIQSCKENNLDLISLSSDLLQKHICRSLLGNDAKKVWIGTRRSSLTGDWYWLNNHPFNDTNWAHKEPGGVDDGQCAVMSLEANGDCVWMDKSCCEDIRPLCYKPSVILQI